MCARATIPDRAVVSILACLSAAGGFNCLRALPQGGGAVRGPLGPVLLSGSVSLGRGVRGLANDLRTVRSKVKVNWTSERSRCARAAIPDRAVISILACFASAGRVASLMGEHRRPPGGFLLCALGLSRLSVACVV